MRIRHDHDRHLVQPAELGPLHGGLCSQRPVQRGFDFILPTEAQFAGDQALVCSLLVQFKRLAQGTPLIGRGDGDAHPSVTAGVHTHRRIGREAVDAATLHRNGVALEEMHMHFAQHDIGFQDAHIKAARIGRRRRKHGCTRCDVGRDARHDGGLSVAEESGRAFNATSHLRQARQGLNDQVAARPVAVGSGLAAEPAERNAGDARLRVRSLKSTRLARDHQVCLSTQGQKRRGILGAGEPLLARVQIVCVTTVGIIAGVVCRRVVPSLLRCLVRWVADQAGQSRGVMQCDDAHVGAGITEQAAAVGCCCASCDLQHLESGQGRGRGVHARDLRSVWPARACGQLIQLAGESRLCKIRGRSIRPVSLADRPDNARRRLRRCWPDAIVQRRGNS